MKQRAQQQGFLLIAAVVLIVVGAVLATVIAFLYATSGQSGVDHLRSAQALFIAESGHERGVRALLAPPLGERIACSDITGDASLTNVAYGKGEYTVTETNSGVALYNGGTTASPSVVTLSADITAGQTTIPVSAITGYARPVASDDPAGGRVLIDREVIDYSDISNDAAQCGAVATPCLLGAQRGRDGTTAASHASGTRLGQYQCNLKSEAGVPTLTADDRGKRTLQQGVQLQEAWAVGAVTGGATGDFNAVYCTASNNCWAVGDDGDIARWDGAKWSNVTSPTGQNINDVFCVAANDCWAVADRSGNNFVFVRWNGTTWSTVTVPSGNRANLNGVYCTAGNNCWAVGDRRNNRFIITRWNGAVWSDASIPDPPGPIGEVDLNAVYCVAANDCWAVGDRQGNYFSFVRWNGITWTASRQFSLFRENLNGVYCTASNNCWAVGQDRFNTFMVIIRWNGTTWLNQSFNPPGNSRDLNDVFCASANDCWAVGDRDGNNFVFARWNGTAWSKYTVTDAANRENLFGVHCVAANDCWAVGAGDAFIRWDGVNWTVPTPTPALQRWNTTAWSNAAALLPTGIDDLNAVSMLSYADGWAVGDRTGGNATIIRWTGSSWASNLPNPAINRSLEAVHAISATDAWAVGRRRGCPPNPSRVTILRWNGTAWQCSSVPSRATVDENLRGVFMLDTNNDGMADDGWAVGDRDGGSFTILRWNNSCSGASTGTNAWAYCPLASTNRQRLNSVFCVAANDCWAVGNNRNNRFIILRWNGTAWSDASVLDAANDQDLNDIYCTAADNCWAVGDRNGNNFTFVRWNGTSWTAVPLTDAANRANLNGVACTTANDCWAVGDERNNNYIFMHWDGTAWTAEVVTGAANNEDLNGVALIGHRRRPQSAWREEFP